MFLPLLGREKLSPPSRHFVVKLLGVASTLGGELRLELSVLLPPLLRLLRLAQGRLRRRLLSRLLRLAAQPILGARLRLLDVRLAGGVVLGSVVHVLEFFESQNTVAVGVVLVEHPSRKLHWGSLDVGEKTEVLEKRHHLLHLDRVRIVHVVLCKHAPHLHLSLLCKRNLLLQVLWGSRHGDRHGTLQNHQCLSQLTEMTLRVSKALSAFVVVLDMQKRREGGRETWGGAVSAVLPRSVIAPNGVTKQLVPNSRSVAGAQPEWSWARRRCFRFFHFFADSLQLPQ